MEALTWWLVAVAAVLVVIFTSLIKQVNWTDKTKNLIATVLSGIAGFVALWASGDFNAEDLTQTILAVYGLSQAFYNFILRGTVINTTLEAVGHSAPVPEETVPGDVDEPIEHSHDDHVHIEEDDFSLDGYDPAEYDVDEHGNNVV